MDGKENKKNTLLLTWEGVKEIAASIKRHQWLLPLWGLDI